MVEFSGQEWVILLLVFLLGLLLGMAAMAGGGRWRHKYREELRARQAAEAERDRARADTRHAEARTVTGHVRDERPLT
jgi:uncharacterized MAPEG superfamily protein